MDLANKVDARIGFVFAAVLEECEKVISETLDDQNPGPESKYRERALDLKSELSRMKCEARENAHELEEELKYRRAFLSKIRRASRKLESELREELEISGDLLRDLY